MVFSSYTLSIYLLAGLAMVLNWAGNAILLSSFVSVQEKIGLNALVVIYLVLFFSLYLKNTIYIKYNLSDFNL